MMSYFYKQNFVSPTGLFAEVKEELSSYFLAGAIDDIMFPKWTEHCLSRFRKSSFRILETIIDMEDYQACLPPDFNSVREVWLTSITNSISIQSPSACYYQEDCRIDIPMRDKCDPCFDNECTTEFMVTHKVTDQFFFSFKRTFLLKPGNLHARNCCGENSPNIHSNCNDTFDIINGKIITSFPTGTLHLMYYAEPIDNEGNQLVPDNFWVQDYIRKYIIYKCFQKLSNIIVDETFNQIQLKLQYAERQKDEAFILAETELKKKTVDRIFTDISNQQKRFNNRYRIR